MMSRIEIAPEELVIFSETRSETRTSTNQSGERSIGTTLEPPHTSMVWYLAYSLVPELHFDVR